MTLIKLLYTPVGCHDCLVKFGCPFVMSLGVELGSLWAFADVPICSDCMPAPEPFAVECAATAGY